MPVPPIDHDPEIDLALDGDPEPAPENATPAAREAQAEGLIAAPPNEPPPPAAKAPRPRIPQPQTQTPPPPTARPETVQGEPAPGETTDSMVAGTFSVPARSAPPTLDPVEGQAAALYTIPAQSTGAADDDTAPPRSLRIIPPATASAGAPRTPTQPGPADQAGLNAGQQNGRAPESTQAPGGAPAGAPDQPGDLATAGKRGPWADLEGGGYEPDDRTHELITAYPTARPGPAGAIHGVGITVLVTDLNRSIAFYHDLLGFFEIDRSTASAVLASGDTRLVLRTVHDVSAQAGRLIYLNLEVGDLEAVYAELKSQGVTFVHGPRPVSRGDKLELWAASFSDPDNHNIAITEWRAIH